MPAIAFTEGNQGRRGSTGARAHQMWVMAHESLLLYLSLSLTMHDVTYLYQGEHRGDELQHSSYT